MGGRRSSHGVVHGQEAAYSQQASLHEGLVESEVARLVDIQENEVEALSLARQRLQERLGLSHSGLYLSDMRGGCPVLSSHLGGFLLALQGHHASILADGAKTGQNNIAQLVAETAVPTKLSFYNILSRKLS